MRLRDLDGGIHSIADLNKKFHRTVIYATTPECTTPTPIYVREMDSLLYYSTSWGDRYVTCPLVSVELISTRPLAGIYNTSQNRPLQVSYLPTRQWRVGWCEDNIAVNDVKGLLCGNLSNVGELKHLECFFNPQYPTIEQAFDSLRKEEKKHIAINSSISIMKTKTKYIVFRNFVPFLAIINGMCIKVPPASSVLQKDFQYYGNILRPFAL